MVKPRRGLMISSVLFLRMGVIGFEVYTAFLFEPLSFNGSSENRNNNLDYILTISKKIMAAIFDLIVSPIQPRQPMPCGIEASIN